MSRFYRLKEDKMVAGVCSGLAHYFYVDVTLVRIVFLVGLFAFDSGVFLGYFIFAIVMPERSKDEIIETTDDNENRLRDLGVVLVVLGLLFMLKKFVPLSWHDNTWSIALIILGIYLVYDGSRRRKNE